MYVLFQYAAFLVPLGKNGFSTLQKGIAQSNSERTPGISNHKKVGHTLKTETTYKNQNSSMWINSGTLFLIVTVAQQALRRKKISRRRQIEKNTYKM